MSLRYIRDTYQVPAFRGRRVRYTGGTKPREGTITAASGGYLRVLLDGQRRPVTLHPNWKVEYLEKHAGRAPEMPQAPRTGATG